MYLNKFTLCACLICISSCIPSNNNKIDNVLEIEFLSKAKQNKAKFFDYQHDPLTPQKSFFIDNKLKYLTFRHGPEIGFIEGRVTFDLTTDSIEKYTLRQVLPTYESETKVYDTIFVFYPKRHNAEIYYGNIMISTTYRQDIFTQQIPFMYELKLGTEKEFNTKSH